MNLKLLIFLLILPFQAIAFPHGGGPSPNAIGGVSIGAQGASGIYSGYTLAAGDDFTSSLNIVTATTPNAPYFPTIAYEAGARTTTSLLSQQWDSDPFYTGANDSNRGVAVGSTNMSQQNSLLTLQARQANSTEIPNISSRTYVTAGIHTGGYVVATPPFIIEALITFSHTPLPSGWHPTFWVRSANALNAGSTPGLEFDMEANQYNGSVSTNLHNNVNNYATSGWASAEGNGTPDSVFDNTPHLLSMVLTTSSIKYYVDGTLHATVSGNTATPAKPYYMLTTSHIINPTGPTDWNSALESMAVDYYRIWIPNANYPSQVIQPTQSLPTLKVAYNTSMTYTFPSATTLWGAGISDYCQGIKFEDYEPGSNTVGTGNYIQFPAGLSYNSGTRVLTGITTDKQPGRIHTSCTANVAGGAAIYVARGYIDVGPNITTTNLSATNGVPFSYDVYPDANCGPLVPKVLTVTGLPAWASFSPTTGLITGTPNATGTTAITIGVTNSSGQAATKNINLVVS